MKHKGCIIVFATLALLLINITSSGIHFQTAKADSEIRATDQLILRSVVDDWSMYRHDPQRTGTTTASIPMAIYSGNSTLAIKSVPPSRTNGVVYEGSNNGYCLRLECCYWLGNLAIYCGPAG